MTRHNGCNYRRSQPDLAGTQDNNLGSKCESRPSLSDRNCRIWSGSTRKKDLAFFSNSETHGKSRRKFGQPWNTFGKPEYGQSIRASPDTSHVSRKQRQQNARTTNSREGRLLCFRCGRPGHFARECFSNKSTSRKDERNNGHPKSQETGKLDSTYAEAARRNTRSGKLATDGS